MKDYDIVADVKSRFSKFGAICDVFPRFPCLFLRKME